jgi:hypothetical protein
MNVLSRPALQVAIGERSHPGRPVYFKKFHTSPEDVGEKDFKELGSKVLKYHLSHPKKPPSEFFGVMANEPKEWDEQSDVIWRPSFVKVCGKMFVTKMVDLACILPRAGPMEVSNMGSLTKWEFIGKALSTN